MQTETDQDPDPETPPSPVVGPSKPRLLSILGPGLITGASDDDPSGIATYSQTGAQFGYGLTWTMLFSYPLMSAVQMISARLGRTTGRGIAGNLRQHYPNWLLLGMVLPLLVANTINIGADLGAMADATHLLLGGAQLLYVLLFASVCTALQVFLQYTRYVAVLKWLTLALFAYVATLFMVKVPWGEAMTRLVVPKVAWSKDVLTTIVAVLGTTISPYLFFWQASQEAEDVRTIPRRKILKRAPEQGEAALNRIELDTLAGMGISNLIALAIMITTAATLNVKGVTDIALRRRLRRHCARSRARSPRRSLRSGSSARGCWPCRCWPGRWRTRSGKRASGRWPARQPMEARAFYATVALATLVGMILNFTPVNPIRALYWSAVINGVVAVPVMIVMMLMSAEPKVMGPFVVTGWLKAFGWVAAGIMTAAVIAMLATSF